MEKVRWITLIGFALSILALIAISYSLPAAIGLGICGMVVSLFSMLTSKDDPL